MAKRKSKPVNKVKRYVTMYGYMPDGCNLKFAIETETLRDFMENGLSVNFSGPYFVHCVDSAGEEQIVDFAKFLVIKAAKELDSSPNVALDAIA